MKKKLLKFLSKECAGSAALETTLLSPIVYITFLFMLYFFFMVMTYISYNNLANTIAQDLNMRQTGYGDAKAAYPTMPHIVVNNLNNGNQQGGSTILRGSDIIAQYSENDVLRSGVYYSLDKNRDRLCIPYSQIRSVRVTTDKPVCPSQGNGMAGNVVKVVIEYQSFMNINGNGIFGMGTIYHMPNMRAVGFNVIS